MPKLFLILLLSILTACGGGGSATPTAQAAPAVAPDPKPAPQTLQAYLFLGQSNMVGHGVLAELPSNLRGPQASKVFLNGAWVQYDPSLDVSQHIASHQPAGCPTCIGPEVALGPLGVGIVKFAVNSSGLQDDWLGPEDFLTQAIGLAKQAASAQPVQWKGIFWEQGESDAAGIEAEQAANYAQNLRTLVSRLRAELGQGDIPVTTCRINPPAIPQWAYRDTVRAAQMNPGITNYRWVDCDGLPIGPDTLHFTTAGIVQMGELFSAVTP